jgi:ABC-type amino acid transport substrate-binding protein
LEGFAAARNLRLEVVVVDSWKNLIPALRAGRGDVIAGSFTDTPQRRTQIAFTHEVFPTQVVVINLAPRPILTSPADLRKEIVGAAPGSSMRELALAAGIPASRIRDFPGNINTDVDALRAGRATAALADLPSALTAQQVDANIQIGPTLGPPGSLAFGVRIEDVHLRSKLDRHIANLRLSGAWSRLVVTYWGAQTLAIVERIHATRDANER